MGIAAFLLTGQKNFNIGMHSDVYESIWMKFIVLPQRVGLLKLLLNLFCTGTIQVRELCWQTFFVKYTSNITLCQDTVNRFVSNLVWC